MLRLLFPPICHICKSTELSLRETLCKKCLQFLFLLPARAYHKSACFEKNPASKALLLGNPRTRAAYLVIQHNRLGWPLPEYIVPIGDPTLAKSFARLIKRPYRKNPPPRSRLLFIGDYEQTISFKKYNAKRSDMLTFLQEHH